MIHIDSRTGSVELLPYFSELGVSTSVELLPFGDFAFTGNGPDGPVMVGVERKTIEDLMACIPDKRLAGHQIPGMVRHYDLSWLLVEGIKRARPGDGALEVTSRGGWRDFVLARRRFLYRDLDHFLLSLQLHAPIRVVETDSMHMTAVRVAGMWSYFQKDWWDHASQHGFHVTGPEGPVEYDASEPSLLRRWAKELPGIGWKRSKAVEMHFHSPLEMALANQESWRQVDGVGAITSVKVVQAIRGEA